MAFIVIQDIKNTICGHFEMYDNFRTDGNGVIRVIEVSLVEKLVVTQYRHQH